MQTEHIDQKPLQVNKPHFKKFCHMHNEQAAFLVQNSSYFATRLKIKTNKISNNKQLKKQ